MSEYKVIWEIETEADNSYDAAEQAWEIMKENDNWATFLKVRNIDTGSIFTYDMLRVKENET